MATLRFEDVAIRLHPADTVAVAKRPLKAGTELTGDSLQLTAAQDIPAGHKVALCSVPDGAPVLKYGQTIGFAQGAIAPGEHVHTHNLAMKDFARDCLVGTEVKPVQPYPPEQMRHFEGYARPGGRVGTRNYLAVISVVNCSASVSRFVAERFRGDDFRRDFPNVDGVVAFTHKTGCGLQPGAPLDTVERVFAGLARHPNIAGYVMIGLGCEVSYVQRLRETYPLEPSSASETAPVFLNIQNAGGTRKTVEAAAAAVAKLLPAANAMRRTRQPISKLVLATNCGGSDGNSGITANPALGVAGNRNYVELTYTSASAGAYLSYYYYVSGGGGWFTSSGAFQQLSRPPITPPSQTSCVGDTVTLSLAAPGLEGLQYQWRRNGVALGGQTSATLTLQNIQFDQAGSYTVMLSGCGGTGESEAATVTVVGTCPAPLSLAGRTYRYSMNSGQASGVLLFLDNQWCVITPDGGATIYAYYAYSRLSYNGGRLVTYVWTGSAWDTGYTWLTYSAGNTASVDQWYYSSASGTWFHQVGSYGPR